MRYNTVDPNLPQGQTRRLIAPVAGEYTLADLLEASAYETARDALWRALAKRAAQIETYGLCPTCDLPLGPSGHREIACDRCGYSRTIEYVGLAEGPR